MSRFDRIVARRQEAARPARVIFENAGPGRRRAKVQEKVLKDKAGQTIKNEDGSPKTVIRGQTTSAMHRAGDDWYRARLADMAERRIVKPHGSRANVVTYKPREVPLEQIKANMQRLALETARKKMGPVPRIKRPADMTRQVHRALFRAACKRRRLPWRTPS